MDRALWLLLYLRGVGLLRHWGRRLRTFRGLLLAGLGALLLAPAFLAGLLAPSFQVEAQLALVRRYGPFALLGFCILNIVLSSDERAVYFAPAEVEFLFSGPFRRRQLLLYRIVGGIFSSVFVALFMTLFFALYAHSALYAFAGLFLTIEILSLISMAVGLVVSTVGALAFNRQRKLVLAALAVLIVVAVVLKGRPAEALRGTELLTRLEESAVLRPLSWPFRAPAMAFAADRLWPDLAGWFCLGLFEAAAIGIAVVALDAEYYEATAAASARMYAVFRARRQGKVTEQRVRTPIQLPMLPWWGGAGPTLWRQLSSAVRFPTRFFLVLFFHVMPLLPALLVMFMARGSPLPAALEVRVFVLLMASVSLAMSMITGFDFRSDLDRMDTLKSLPVSAPALVVAELVVPTLILSLAQAICLAIMAAVRGTAGFLLDALLFLPPYNALLVATEAIMFLWFPNRIVPGSSMDFTLMGRQFLMMFSKLTVVGFCVGVATGFGALGYLLVAPSWALALGLTWLSLASFVVLMVPIAAAAFRRFDVARDTPP
jgi:hypothetical protein